MHELYELKEKLLKELMEYSQNGKFSKEDAENIKYIASAIDHICNIVERAEEEEYSQRGGQGGGNRYSYEGGQGGNQGGYSRNRGYARTGGSYARGRGSNARRDSMGRYSREGGYARADGVEEMVGTIREMMQDLPPEMQQDAQRFVQQLEQQM